MGSTTTAVLSKRCPNLAATSLPSKFSSTVILSARAASLSSDAVFVVQVFSPGKLLLQPFTAHFNSTVFSEIVRKVLEGALPSSYIFFPARRVLHPVGILANTSSQGQLQKPSAIGEVPFH